jgi:hypothetical protein
MAEYIDNSRFFASVSSSWQEYFRGDNLAEQFLSVAQSCTCLPEPHIQWPLIASFALANPKFSRCLPALFLYGKPGSGKSSLGKVIAQWRGGKIHSETTTYAGLRNYLHFTKFYGSESEDEEPREKDGALLFLDNVYASTFEGDKGMLFLAGYKRSDDTVEIATPGTGQNMQFHTFSSRIFSSIEPLHTDYSLRELARRTVLINCQPLTEFENDFDADSSLDPDSVNWEGFNSVYWRWWNDAKNILLLQTCYMNQGKRVRRPKKIDAGRWEQIRDLTAVGIATGIWADWPTAIDYWVRYFDWLNEKLSIKSQLEQLFQSKIDADINCVPIAIISKWLKEWQDDGLFIDKPRHKDVANAMQKMGFTLKAKEWERV